MEEAYYHSAIREMQEQLHRIERRVDGIARKVERTERIVWAIARKLGGIDIRMAALQPTAAETERWDESGF